MISANRIVKLGKEIKISPKSVGVYEDAGHEFKTDRGMIKIEFSVGDNRHGVLFIELDALQALKAGERIKTVSNVQLRKNI